MTIRGIALQTPPRSLRQSAWIDVGAEIENLLCWNAEFLRHLPYIASVGASVGVSTGAALRDRHRGLVKSNAIPNASPETIATVDSARRASLAEGLRPSA